MKGKPIAKSNIFHVERALSGLMTGSMLLEDKLNEVIEAINAINSKDSIEP